MSFSTLNKFDDQGHPITYDNFPTEDKAIARIVELKALGLTDAFYIDDDATAVDGKRVISNPKHWVADTVNKTVTLNTTSFNDEVKKNQFKSLRRERDEKLDDTDWWVMRGSMTDAQTAYRQALRDLPANTADPSNITWPEEPS